MKPIHIHFVCTGNAYRSRLAEAYLRSKKLPHVIVSSSGIGAKKYYFENGPISWYAARLIKRHNLIPHTAPMSVNTTSRHLERADVVIFMENEQYRHAKSNLKFKKDAFEIWDIPDIDDADFFNTERDSDEMRIQFSEKTFTEIKHKVDELAKKLSNANR